MPQWKEFVTYLIRALRWGSVPAVLYWVCKLRLRDFSSYEVKFTPTLQQLNLDRGKRLITAAIDYMGKSKDYTIPVSHPEWIYSMFQATYLFLAYVGIKWLVNQHGPKIAYRLGLSGQPESKEKIPLYVKDFKVFVQDIKEVYFSWTFLMTNVGLFLAMIYDTLNAVIRCQALKVADLYMRVKVLEMKNEPKMWWKERNHYVAEDKQHLIGEIRPKPVDVNLDHILSQMSEALSWYQSTLTFMITLTALVYLNIYYLGWVWSKEAAEARRKGNIYYHEQIEAKPSGRSGDHPHTFVQPKTVLNFSRDLWKRQVFLILPGKVASR